MFIDEHRANINTPLAKIELLLLPFQALCSALRAPMEVFSAMSPPLLLGQDYEGPPLLLTYHEHYYALGSHYNSVVPAP